MSPRQYMTDGQFEEFCQRSAAASVDVIESTVKMALPHVFGREIQEIRAVVERLFPIHMEGEVRVIGPNIIDRVDRLERELREILSRVQVF